MGKTIEIEDIESDNIVARKINNIDLKKFGNLGLDQVDQLGEIKPTNSKLLKEIDELIESSLKIALICDKKNRKSCLSLYEKSVAPKLIKISSQKSKKMPLGDLKDLVNELHCVLKD